MPSERTKPETLLKHYDHLKSERSNYDRLWQDIADYMRPIRAEFNVIRHAGERRTTKVVDSTALRAVDNFSGGMFGWLTNPANRWFALKVEDDELNEFDPVKDWLYEVENRLLYSFGPEMSRFYAVVPSFYADLACFGNAVFYSEEDGNRINDNVRPLSECVFAENALGMVDTVYRKFRMSGRQAVQMFGADRLHQKMVQRVEKEPFETHWFIHCVYPYEEVEGEQPDLMKRPFLSVYLDCENKHEVARGGYWEFPYQVPRWAQASGEQYGRGLGELNIADVKMLNRMVETNIKAAQKIADPPMGAPDEGVIKAARTWPGGVTYGAIDMEGRQLFKPLFTGGDTRLTNDFVARQQETVKEGFYFSLMQQFQKGDMTATEWMGRQQEKLRLLGPNLGRLQHEFLSPLIGRRYGMMTRMNALPKPPREAQGLPIKVDYVSPLDSAQRASESQAVMRFVESLGMIAQVDPAVIDNMDTDEAVKVLARGWAVPATVLKGKEDVQAAREQRAMMQNVQAGAQLADVGSKALKQVADASKSGSQASQIQNETQKQGGADNIGNLVAMLRSAIQSQTQGRPN